MSLLSLDRQLQHDALYFAKVKQRKEVFGEG